MAELGEQSTLSHVTRDPATLTPAGRLSFLAKDTAVYGIAGAISKGFGLITFPLLARHLSVEDFGILDYLLVASSLIAVAIVFGQDSAVARFFYETNDQSFRTQLISQSLFLQLAVACGLTSLLYLLAPLGVEKFRIDFADPVVLRLALLQAPLLALINFSQNLLKWTFERAKFLTLTIGAVISHLGIVIFVVIAQRTSLELILSLYLVNSATFALLGLWFTRKWLTIPKSLNTIGDTFRYATPLGLVCILGAIVPAIERSAIIATVGEDSLGIYAAATKIAMFMSMVVHAFQTSWAPFSLAIFKSADAASIYNLILKAFTLAICCASIILAAIADPLITVLASERYAGASKIVFPIAMALSIQGVGWIIEVGINISKKTHLAFLSYGIFAAITIIGIVVLGRSFGIIGVACGVLIGQAAKTITSYFLAQRAKHYPWEAGRCSILIAATTVAGLCLSFAQDSFSSIEIAIAGIGTCLAITALAVPTFFSRKERLAAKNRIKTSIQKLIPAS